jgi:glycerol-3-phosphate dehydrogenase
VVQHYCRQEWARHLDDLLLRRTSWHYYYRASDQVAERASQWMAAELQWSEQRRRQELERCAELEFARISK